MKFNIFKKDFYQGIQIVQRAVSSKNTLPIITGIYIEAIKDKGLHLMATDLEIGIEYWINTDIIEEGSIVIPANQLTGIVRELPAADIQFEVNEDNYQIKIKCLTSEFVLNGFQAEEFPQLPEVDIPKKFNLPAGKFKEMIQEVKFSTSTDQSQPGLTGGLMVIEDDFIKMVTTNTYRLAYRQLNLDKLGKERMEVIIPANTLNELVNLISDDEENIEVLVNDNYIRFNFNDIILISRLIEGKFPNYRQVMPSDYNTRVKVDRNNLLMAVKRASLIARLESNIISISIDNDVMNINSIKSDSGHAHEEVEIEKEGPEQRINIDAGYLLDVLKALKDEIVVLDLIGPLNPLTVKKESDDDYVYLIMPVREEA